jgi:hypothetical protein
MNNIDAIADDHEKIPVVPDPQSDRMAGEPGRDDADEAAFDEVWTNCLDSIRKENYQAAATFLGAAFWLDVDGYATPQEALGALRGFCAVTGLPKPSPVISSGPVIHVYWLMSEFVPRERRLEAARMLKALTTAHKLLVACTEDIETVLRPVGTRNFKNPAMPQTVATLHPRDGAPPRRFDLAKFEVLLGAAVHALPQAVRTASSATSGPRPSQTLAGEITGQFDWVDYTEAVAADIFGACNETMSRPPEDVRFGNKGSVSVNVTTGIWYDHENERGGGIKELIRVYKEIDDHGEAIAYARECQQQFENGGLSSKPSSSEKTPEPRPNSGNGQTRQELEAAYPYHDAAGQVAFEVVRYIHRQADGGYVVDERGKRKKSIYQRRPSGEPDGSFIWGLDAGEFMRPAPGSNWVKFKATKFEQYPINTRQQKSFPTPAPVVPYRLHDLIKAVAAGQTICIPEGEKKVDLIRSKFGFPATCCAEGAKKWLAEHSAFLKGADVVLLPDNDESGREHVELIAESLASVAKRIRILTLPNLKEKEDVIDWHAAGGTAEEFARLVAAAPDYVPDEAAGPQPLTRPLPDPEPFPLEALGPELAPIAQAICDVVQCPIEMCGSSVLASVSFAISAHVDIRLPTGETKPTSSWFWISARSGERKDTVDDWAFGPQKRHERDLKRARVAAMAAHEVKNKMWKSEAKAIETEFKKKGAAGSDAHQKALERLGPEPEAPLETVFMSSNFTYEGLFNSLNIGQPIYGIVGTEGGQFLGGHGMKSENRLHTVTNLNDLWDGKPSKRVRAQELLALYGRRVGMSLMIQPAVTETALSDALLSQVGFMGRILLCEPKSLIGLRPHKEAPPEARQHLQRYDERMREILNTPYQLAPDTRNELQPRVVLFSAEAAALFREFYNAVEAETAPGKEYESIAPLAAKLPQHAARLGATIAAYRNLDFKELGVDDFKCGMHLAYYYAGEAKRLFGANAGPSEPVAKLPPAQKVSLAQTLLDWLAKWKKPIVSVRDIYTHGPRSIRVRESAIALAEILVEHGHLVSIKTSRPDSKKWQVARRPSA